MLHLVHSNERYILNSNSLRDCCFFPLVFHRNCIGGHMDFTRGFCGVSCCLIVIELFLILAITCDN